MHLLLVCRIVRALVQSANNVPQEDVAALDALIAMLEAAAKQQEEQEE